MDDLRITRRRALALALAASAAHAQAPAAAQGTGFPNRVISLVVPFPPGGGTDLVGRLIALALGDVLPQKVIVVNRGGAGGLVGSQSVKAAPPDGHTLMFTSQSIVTQAYDSGGKVSDKDFVFLGVLNQDAIGIAVEQKARWRSIREFVDEARQNPGVLSVANSGVGSVTQMQIPLIEKAAGIRLNPIPFAGSAGTHSAVLAGTTHAASVVVGDAAGLIKEGKMRLLATMSASRLDAFPDVPTLRELGIAFDVPEFGFDFWGPGNMPPALAERITRAIEQAVHDPGFVQASKALVYKPVFVGPEKLKESIRNFENNIGPKMMALFPPAPKK